MVKVSAVLVEVTREQVDQPVSTLPDTDSDDADVTCASWLDRWVDCCDIVVGGPASASLSGADWRVDFAGDVAVGVAFPAVFAEGVTIGVTSPAVAQVASPAVAGAVSWQMLVWRPRLTLLGVSQSE